LDVTTLLEFFDLRDVVLVGHSYGGMVVTAAADRLPDRVAGVLYLDAVVAGDGQSLLDAIAPERAAGLQAAVRDHGDGWRLPGAPDVARSYGVTDPEDLAWAGPLITDQPFATFTQPLALTGAVDRIPQAYVHFTRADIIPAAAAHAVRDRGALWRELPLMHDAMITHPDAVADCVLELVTELRGDGSA
jgi:pimeloyl-ACP methyl ester carboxylesterase